MKFLLILLSLGGIFCFTVSLLDIDLSPHLRDNYVDLTSLAEPEVSGIDSNRLTTELPNQIKNLKKYIAANPGKYSENKAILIDMRIPSKYNRFFIVDLKTGKIVDRNLVSHGSGSETSISDSLQFSNLSGSYMTSLGTYKIGASYIGNFGKSYKLHGLEKSNSKAFDRLVVLHRYSCVPENGEQTENICTSLGCPMVSEAFFPIVEKCITAEGKPMLLRIYY